MAIFHLKAKIHSRTHGKNAIASAAYRAGEKLWDDRLGKMHDYSRKKGVVHREILSPPDVPEWVLDREQLWNQVEASEKRIDSQVAREVMMALPRELNQEGQVALVKQFCQTYFVDQGMVADIAIHNTTSNKNPHAHVLLTTRTISREGFGNKNRTWNKTDHVPLWREQWAIYTNAALEQAGRSERIDHRSLAERGIQRIPQIHLGPTVVAMEEKARQRGETEPVTERMRLHQTIQQRNQELEEAEAELERLNQERERLEAAIRRQELADQMLSTIQVLKQSLTRMGAAKIVMKQGTLMIQDQSFHIIRNRDQQTLVTLDPEGEVDLWEGSESEAQVLKQGLERLAQQFLDQEEQQQKFIRQITPTIQGLKHSIAQLESSKLVEETLTYTLQDNRFCVIRNQDQQELLGWDAEDDAEDTVYLWLGTEAERQALKKQLEGSAQALRDAKERRQSRQKLADEMVTTLQFFKQVMIDYQRLEVIGPELTLKCQGNIFSIIRNQDQKELVHLDGEDTVQLWSGAEAEIQALKQQLEKNAQNFRAQENGQQNQQQNQPPPRKDIGGRD